MQRLQNMFVAGCIAVCMAVPGPAMAFSFDPLLVPLVTAGNGAGASLDDAGTYRIAQKGGGRVTPPPRNVQPGVGAARAQSANPARQSMAGRIAARGKAAFAAMRKQGSGLLKAGASALKRPAKGTREAALPATQAQMRQRLSERSQSAAVKPAAGSGSSGSGRAVTGVPLGTPTSFDHLRGTLRTRFNDAAAPGGGSSAAQDKPPQPSPPRPPGTAGGIVGPKF